MKLNVFYQMKLTPYDCYIEIHAGAGGTESQDWAEMLKKNVYEMVRSKEFKSSID